MRILQAPPLPRPFQRPERIALDFRHLRPHELDEAVQAEQLKQTKEQLEEDVYQTSVRDEARKLATWLIAKRQILTVESVREFIALLEKEDE